MGGVNGLLVAGLGLPSIVVTLATMVTWQEALRLWQQGKLLNLPPGVQWFGLAQQTGQVALILSALALVAIAAWGMIPGLANLVIRKPRSMSGPM